MSLFRACRALLQRIRGIRGSKESGGPADGEQWREAFAVAFSGLVLDKPPTSTLVESLPSETHEHILSARFDEIEARIFDLWLVSNALRRSIRHIPRVELLAILDAGHFEVFRQLISAGMSEEQIMTLQHRLAQRYAEYDDAYAAFWNGEQNWMFPFARLVTSRVFRHETSDLRVAATLALAVVNPTVISIGKAFGDFKPPTK